MSLTLLFEPMPLPSIQKKRADKRRKKKKAIFIWIFIFNLGWDWRLKFSHFKTLVKYIVFVMHIFGYKIFPLHQVLFLLVFFNSTKSVAILRNFSKWALWNLSYNKSNKKRISYIDKKTNTKIHKILQFPFTCFLTLKLLHDSLLSMLQVTYLSKFYFNKIFHGLFLFACKSLIYC